MFIINYNMNSLEILDKKEQLRNQACALIDNAKKEVRMLSDEENVAFENIKTELKKLDEEERKLKAELSVDKNINIENNTMEKNFSLLRAIRSIANNQPFGDVESAVINAGQNEMRKSGINYTGQIQLPSAESRAAITVATEGVDTVATDLFDVVKPLQAKNVMVQAGAKFVTGLVGDIQYPVMSKANVTWEGETAAAKNGEPTFTNVKLSPKRLTAVVAISKQFLVQDSVGAEAAIREEIINALNAKLESTILGSGAGSATEPAGLFSIVAPSTTVAAFSDICNMEAGLEGADFYGEYKYVMAPTAKATLRGMIKGTNATGMVYENGEVDGSTALCTTHVPASHLVVGDFSQYIIGSWGTIDLVVDNVTLAADGQIRLVVNAFFDAKPLRNNAFVTATV